MPQEWRIYQLDRYQILLAQMTDEVQRYLRDTEETIEAASAVQVRRGSRDATTLIHTVAHEAGGSVRVTPMNLNAAAVENVVSIARAGQPLEALMVRSYADAADGMVQQLIQGIALGRNPRETARLMRVDGLAQGFRHTELVARDQHNRAYRLASWQQYQQSGVVKRYRRFAARNERR